MALSMDITAIQSPFTDNSIVTILSHFSVDCHRSAMRCDSTVIGTAIPTLSAALLQLQFAIVSL